jgi:hypothetical protein
MPLYRLILFFPLFVGFAAILSPPTLERSEANLLLPRIPCNSSMLGWST